MAARSELSLTGRAATRITQTCSRRKAWQVVEKGFSPAAYSLQYYAQKERTDECGGAGVLDSNHFVVKMGARFRKIVIIMEMILCVTPIRCPDSELAMLA